MMDAVSVVIALTVTIVPISSGVLPSTQITINNQPGWQRDPHLDGDLACYLSDTVDASGGMNQEIRYHDFITAQDVAISNVLPGGSHAADMACDVSQGQVIFTRFSNRATLMRFDTSSLTLTDLLPNGSTSVLGGSVGGHTVAFVDVQFGPGEMMVFDLNSSAVSRLTNDQVSDAYPDVAPTGNVIVWERCALGDCDIYQAQWTGGSWAVQALTSHPATERSPATNGSLVAFHREDGSAPTQSDIVFVPVSGPGEIQLEIAGDDFNPAISGDFIAFEHYDLTTTDIYLYDLVGNRLFQVTNTATLYENLSDIFVLPGGQVRVIWQASSGSGSTLDQDVYAATFSIPPLQCSWYCAGPSAGNCVLCPTLWDQFDWDMAAWH